MVLHESRKSTLWKVWKVVGVNPEREVFDRKTLSTWRIWNKFRSSTENVSDVTGWTRSLEILIWMKKEGWQKRVRWLFCVGEWLLPKRIRRDEWRDEIVTKKNSSMWHVFVRDGITGYSPRSPRIRYLSNVCLARCDSLHMKHFIMSRIKSRKILMNNRGN